MRKTIDTSTYRRQIELLISIIDADYDNLGMSDLESETWHKIDQITEKMIDLLGDIAEVEFNYNKEVRR